MDRRFLKNPVFSISAVVILVLVVLGAIMPEQFGNVANVLYGFTTAKFGWFFLMEIIQ